MTTKRNLMISMLAALAGCVSASGLQASPEHVKPADNRIYAQILVNEAMAANPDLAAMGIYATPSPAMEAAVVACSTDRIGERDAAAVAVAEEKKTILRPDAGRTGGFEVLLPLKAAPGRVIGALSLVFKSHPGDDEVKLHERALKIRAALAAKIPSTPSLFRIPAAWMSRQ